MPQGARRVRDEHAHAQTEQERACRAAFLDRQVPPVDGRHVPRAIRARVRRRVSDGVCRELVGGSRVDGTRERTAR